MKRLLMIGMSLLCLMAVTGCSNDDSTNLQFSATIGNCLRAENDNFLSGMVMLSETAKEGYSHDNVLQLKAQLDMFVQTNDLSVSLEFINGNVPKDLYVGIMNPAKKEGFMYRFETLDALRSSLDLLSSLAENTKATEEQLEWYQGFTANIAEVALIYRSIGDDFIGYDNLTYAADEFNKIHTLNQLLAQSSQIFDINMSD